MTSSSGKRRRFSRRLERWVLGVGMGIVAWVIERRVLKALKAKGKHPLPSESRPLGELNTSEGKASASE